MRIAPARQSPAIIGAHGLFFAMGAGAESVARTARRRAASRPGTAPRYRAIGVCRFGCRRRSRQVTGIGKLVRGQLAVLVLVGVGEGRVRTIDEFLLFDLAVLIGIEIFEASPEGPIDIAER